MAKKLKKSEKLDLILSELSKLRAEINALSNRQPERNVRSSPKKAAAPARKTAKPAAKKVSAAGRKPASVPRRPVLVASPEAPKSAAG